jgi:L-asparaginase II
VSPPVLAVVGRGTAVESVHRGAVVAVDSAGAIAFAIGDPDLRSFARSAIKPIQALPLAADGGIERFGFTLSELAGVCGSHSGEDFHLAAVRSILGKIGLAETALQCGGHFPFYQPTADAMRARGEAPQPIHDNCSGKHAGMLALARLRAWDERTYVSPVHPVQARIREAIVALTGSHVAITTSAVDGCGVPTYHVALRELATAFARLAAPAVLDAPWQEAARTVTSAMMRFPEMVAGTGRLETVLMGVAAGRLFVKSGGEAIYAVGVPDRGLGVALKIEDGTSRAVGAVVIEALRQLEVLTEEEVRTLAPLHRPPVLTRKGVQVGEITPVFTLQ